MNKLPLAKRVLILNMLCEGSSLRSISRVADVSINTVTKLLVDAGEACIQLHDETVRNVKASRVQCDEIWSFNYCKARTVANAKAAPLDAGELSLATPIESFTAVLLQLNVHYKTRVAIKFTGIDHIGVPGTAPVEASSEPEAG